MLKNLKISVVLVFYIVSLGFSFLGYAEEILNEVLFSIANESSTNRDRLLYQRVLIEVFKKNKMSQFSEKISDDFLLSRLAYKEAKAFEINGEDIKVSEATQKKMSEFSKIDIEREVGIISTALALIQTKEIQLKVKDRFKTWFELIKHKYQFKMKSSEFSDYEK